MKDPTHELLGAIFTAINGNVTYNSIDIPVYNRVLEWGDRPCDQFIQIGSIRMEEDGPKDATVVNGDLDLYIDTFFTGKNDGTRVVVNSISTQLTQLIDTIFSLTGFTQKIGRVTNLEDFDYELDPQGVQFRKLITYQFTIEED